MKATDVPKELYRADVPYGAKVLWIRLFSLQSESQMAYELGTDSDTVRGWLADLVKEGWLEERMNDQGTVHYIARVTKQKVGAS